MRWTKCPVSATAWWAMNVTENPSPLQKPDSLSLALNFLPFLHLALGGILAWWLCVSMAASIGFGLAWIYLLPPLLGRLVNTIGGEPEGTFAMPSRGYLQWWMLMQLQMIFNRLSFLEELLRLVPGLYPLWIWLWGGHLSPLSFVAPKVTITDRHLVSVGRGALLGIDTSLVSHIAQRDEDGRWQVVVAKVVVEPEAITGGGTVLGPGARLLSGHMLPAGRRIVPFGTWPRSHETEGTLEQISRFPNSLEREFGHRFAGGTCEPVPVMVCVAYVKRLVDRACGLLFFLHKQHDLLSAS